MYFIPLLILAVAITLAIFNYRNLAARERSINQMGSNLYSLFKRKLKLINEKEELIKEHSTINAYKWQAVDAIAAKVLAKEQLTAPESQLLNKEFSALFNEHVIEIKGHTAAQENEALSSFSRTWDDYARQLEDGAKAFNSAVNNYNNSIQYFPSSIIAKIAGFRPIENN